MERDRLDDLIARNDPDALVRLVDAYSHAHDWDGLVRVAAACRAALATGRQLWPVASLAEYRLALLAPGPYAAAVVRDGAGSFALGPLTEVAASTHTWAELAPGLDGPRAGYVAQERVVRGEDLHDGDVGADALGLPLVLAPWEPDYPLAIYTLDSASFDPPSPPGAEPAELPTHTVAVEDHESCNALVELAAVWARESNGRVEAIAVEGDHRSAVAALGVPLVRMAEITMADGLAWMGWAGASGGAYGRRRGMALGRFSAWWALAELTGLDLDGSGTDELGAAGGALRWYWWDANEPASGWQLHLAIWDPDDGVAWAVAATDSA
jgi:hypothetical protein